MSTQNADYVRDSIPLSDLLARYKPAFCDNWDEVERLTFERPCMCCGVPGHYQRQVEEWVAAEGLTEGVYLKGDVLGDGHHRVLAAIRLGVAEIPLESHDECNARWVRDHGRVNWHNRKFGDRLPHEVAAMAGRNNGQADA